ncbi:MAG: hypothetical protein QOI95_1091 [Acidimicrobiaceae bacterium]|jgi:hypothetical protein
MHNKTRSSARWFIALGVALAMLTALGADRLAGSHSSAVPASRSSASQSKAGATTTSPSSPAATPAPAESSKPGQPATSKPATPATPTPAAPNPATSKPASDTKAPADGTKPNAPTPATTNRAPVISDVTASVLAFGPNACPDGPSYGTVAARVVDEDGFKATLHTTVVGPRRDQRRVESIPMSVLNDGRVATSFGPYEQGASVFYWVEAIDSHGVSARTAEMVVC